MTDMRWDPKRVASRLIVGLEGPEPTPREAAWLRRWRPAGVIIFARNVRGPGQLAGLCRQVRDILGSAAEIMADQEGGAISVLAAAAGRPPAPYGLGRLGDPDLTRLVHAETAARLRRLGVTRVLAPCADVLVEPRNPVIGTRAFGDDPRRVAEQVSAAVRGLSEGGVHTCLKHWPGHGGTADDSHDGPAVAGKGVMPEPFLAGLAAGADAVMVGHLHVGGGAPGEKLPATLDPAALAQLRGLWAGPPPLVIGDDVTMGALRPAFGAPPGGLIDPADLTLPWLARPMAAGCDLVLCRGLPTVALPVTGPGGVLADSSAPVSAAAAPNASGATAEDPIPPDPPSWREARARQAAGCDRLFPAAARRLLWLDATAGDRWGDASVLAPLLRARFPDGWYAPGGPPGAGPFSALLVTSHRPLLPEPLAALWPELLSEEGGCLVMGHPQLAGAVRPRLPLRWRTAALFDIDAAGWPWQPATS